MNVVELFVIKDTRGGGMPRDGTKNLKPVRNSQEAKERGRAGGIASGEARRRKRTMKEAARLLLELEVAGENNKQNLKRMGIPDEEMNNQMAILVRMLQKALVDGDVNAANFIRSTAGYDTSSMMMADKLENAENATSNVQIFIPDNGRDGLMEEDIIDTESKDIEEDEEPR